MSNSIQIDPQFLSQYLTIDLLIQEMKAFEITEVHFMLFQNWDGSKNEVINDNWIKALQEKGIKVWLMVPASAFYDSSAINVNGEYKTNWLMGIQNPQTVIGGLYLYSFHNEEFIQWQCDKLSRIIDNYPFFDGIEFVESYFPEIEQIVGRNPNASGFYGDVSSFALERFFTIFLGNTVSPVSFNEIINDEELYEKWVEYRIDAVNNFFKKIKEVLIAKNSSLLFAVWGQGKSERENQLELMREYLGLDIIQLIDIANPDYIFIQSAASDYARYPVDPEYLAEYLPIKEAIQSHNPNIPVGVQTDYVSYHYSHQATVPKLDAEWLWNYYQLAQNLGFHSATAYEYGISKRLNTWPSKGAWDYLETGYLSPDESSEPVPVQSEITSILIFASGYWNLAKTPKGLFWFKDIGNHMPIDQKVYAYQYPNLSSPVTAIPFDPQVFFIIGSLGEDWLRIRTASVYSWIYLSDIQQVRKGE